MIIVFLAMQAMADAVENTDFVILCMSDSYKRSVYCQAEAEYAFRCKRRLLPIVVRQGYRADGWLGLIIGSRIYVDFGRLEFKKACELILKEITLQRENQLNNAGAISEKGSHELPHDIAPGTSSMIKTIDQINLPDEYMNRKTIKSTYRSIEVGQWTKKDILDYLYDTGLHHMMPICELMTGHGLIKLFRICQTKPSRLYSQLNDELTSRFTGLHLPIGIFTQFLSEMDRLIDSSSVEAIEQDESDSKSSSSPPPPTSPIVTHIPKTSSSNSLLEPLRKSSIQLSSISSPVQTTSPTVTTIQTSTNVQITEQTAYRTESIVTQSSQESVSILSKQTELTLIDE